MSMRRIGIADALEEKFPTLALIEYELQGDITVQGAMLLDWMTSWLMDINRLDVAKISFESLKRALEFNDDDMEVARDDALGLTIELEDFGEVPVFSSAVNEDEMYFQYDLVFSTLITNYYKSL